MTALADDADVVARLGRALTESETPAATGLLAEASALVAGYVRRDWAALADVPDAVRIVVSRMVARALTGSSNVPAGATQYGSTLSVMSQTVTMGADVVIGSPWLSRTDKVTLSPYVRRYAEHVPMWEGGRQ